MLVNNLRKFIANSTRILVVTILCTLIFISASLPAFASSNPKTTSVPTQGEANLEDIQARTEELATEDPPSMTDVIKKQEGGLNEVQGKADAGQMISPDEAESTSFEEQVGNLFKKVKGK